MTILTYSKNNTLVYSLSSQWQNWNDQNKMIKERRRKEQKPVTRKHDKLQTSPIPHATSCTTEKSNYCYGCYSLFLRSLLFVNIDFNMNSCKNLILSLHLCMLSPYMCCNLHWKWETHILSTIDIFVDESGLKHVQ